MIVGIFGLHCSGKSSLLREVISFNANSFSFKNYESFGLMISKRLKLIVIGCYIQGDLLSGADNISEHKINDVLELIKKLTRSHRDYSIIFEGNTLNSLKMHHALHRGLHEYRPIILSCTADELHSRELKRMRLMSQQEKNLIYKKVESLVVNFPVSTLSNNNQAELERNAKIVLGLLSVMIKTKVR